MVTLPLSTPSISTKSDVVPFVLVTVHGGPGETQPGGVGPGVSQRLAEPPETVVVIPGENWLAVRDADPVWLAVMSVMRTTSGVQVILGFQETVELLVRAVAAGTVVETLRKNGEDGIVRISMKQARTQL